MPLASLLLSFLFLSCVVSHNLPELTNDDFDTRIKEKQYILVMFYAPWCGHCKKLKPDFISAGEKLLNHKDVGFALVDCTTQDKICSRFGVSGYPTLKFFRDGEFYMDYDGSRDENGLMNFAISRSQPPSRLVETPDQLKEILDSESAKRDPVVVSFIQSKTDKLSEIYSKIATELLGKFSFAHTHDAKLLGDNLEKSVIRVYRPKNLVSKLTAAYVDYDGKMDVESIRKWISNNGYGLVALRHGINQHLFPRDNIMIFYHNDSIDKYPKGVKYQINRLIKVIGESGIDKQKLTFVYSYSDDFYHEISDLTSGSETYPKVLIKADGKKYKLEDYSREKLVDFLKSFDAGTLEPFIKSEPIPTEQPSAAMKVVGHTFDSVVNDPSKDVLIMFHAPWCGHCQALKPKFEKVAEKLKDEPGVLLVTYDATANDVPHPYEVRGYPTLYFVSKSSKHSPKLYSGPREEEQLLDFIAKECTEELRGFDRKGKIKTEL